MSENEVLLRITEPKRKEEKEVEKLYNEGFNNLHVT